MSTVWGTRYRLLREQLERLADSLGAQQSGGPAVAEEQTVRLLMGALTLLHQHAVNQRGRCRFCGWTRWGWRIWHRRPRCTVYQAFDIAMAQPTDVVWWQLFQSTGHDVSLAAVRDELLAREAAVEDDETVELERIPE